MKRMRREGGEVAFREEARCLSRLRAQNQIHRVYLSVDKQKENSTSSLTLLRTESWQTTDVSPPRLHG